MKQINSYFPIIGLEIHVELKTTSKMFCGCDAHHFRVEPNTHTCPVCLGLPGALPVPNRKAIEWCQLIGLALNCQLAKQSKFDRKNYFYPDLAKGYQISQYDQPLCYKGSYELLDGKKIGITRVHMEEDTGKNVHKAINGKKMTLVDFNRCGVPLVEIVTEPDFRNTEDVDEFLKGLQKIIRFLGVSDADMEKGSMRLEVNLSLAKIHPEHESETLHVEESLNHNDKSVNAKINLPNYKVEVKNINSFRYVQKAIAYELKRQTEILDKGETPAQETRGYQEDVNKTISQRSKEGAADYRYFPEPDIPPMEFTAKDFSKVKEQLPELPQAKQKKYQKEYNLDLQTVSYLTDNPALSDYFDNAVVAGSKIIKPSKIANLLKNGKFDWQKVTPQQLINDLTQTLNQKGMDENELEQIVQKVITDNPDVVAKYKAGKIEVLGFFIGQVVKETKGKADASKVKILLTKLLQSPKL